MVFENKKGIVAGVYRPFKSANSQTQGQAFQNLVNDLNNLTKTDMEIIIGGDFNINWSSQKSIKAILDDWAKESGMFQLVDLVTRLRKVQRSDGSRQLQESTIDLVFVKETVKLEVLPSISSDHNLIKVSVNHSGSQAKSRVKKLEMIDWRFYKKRESVK